MTQRKLIKQTDTITVSVRRPTALLAEVRDLILQAREGVARAVDVGLTALYWHVGQRIRQDTLKGKRADYGRQIVAAVGRQLTRTHFIALIPLDRPLQREFYAEMCRVERSHPAAEDQRDAVETLDKRWKDLQLGVGRAVPSLTGRAGAFLEGGMYIADGRNFEGRVGIHK